MTILKIEAKRIIVKGLDHGWKKVGMQTITNQAR